MAFYMPDRVKRAYRCEAGRDIFFMRVMAAAVNSDRAAV